MQIKYRTYQNKGLDCPQCPVRFPLHLPMQRLHAEFGILLSSPYPAFFPLIPEAPPTHNCLDLGSSRVWISLRTKGKRKGAIGHPEIMVSFFCDVLPHFPNSLP